MFTFWGPRQEWMVLQRFLIVEMRRLLLMHWSDLDKSGIQFFFLLPCYTISWSYLAIYIITRIKTKLHLRSRFPWNEKCLINTMFIIIFVIIDPTCVGFEESLYTWEVHWCSIYPVFCDGFMISDSLHENEVIVNEFWKEVRYLESIKRRLKSIK